LNFVCWLAKPEQGEVQMTEERLFTTDEVAELIQEKLGAPCPPSRITQDRHRGRGPKPAAKYGRRLLYTSKEALNYGRTLIQPLDATGDGPMTGEVQPST
jgi:hypothetical protein